MGFCCAPALAESRAVSGHSGASARRIEATEASGGPRPSIPESSFLDKRTTDLWKQWLDSARSLRDEYKSCGSLEGSTNIAAIRRCQADVFYKTPMYQSLRARYPVTVTTQNIGGIPTEIFEPVQGVSPQNIRRVLINLHGGGFRGGARTISHTESIPIASVGRIKVISVDYRMMPEHAFPAASEDVEAVYRELIRRFDPKNIGIYGCSAGGVLTAQSVAWLQSKNLPLPGAVGMFCGAGSYWSDGDSGYYFRLFETNSKSEEDILYKYFEHVDHNDPLAFPVRSPGVMARFPPSLLLTSTRDLALSSVVYTHTVLIQQNVPAELHVWEGLGHGFFFAQPELPQSRDAYNIILKFFERYLGPEGGARK
jgi:monoterpene epsilon-lactone hydrolase